MFVENVFREDSLILDKNKTWGHNLQSQRKRNLKSQIVTSSLEDILEQLWLEIGGVKVMIREDLFIDEEHGVLTIEDINVQKY